MTFNSYEELMAVVEDRRTDTLTLEVDISGGYSAEHEAAKKELMQAKALSALTAGQPFLSSNVEELEAKVEATRPPTKSVWLVFRRMPLNVWSSITKSSTTDPLEQFDKVVKDTLIGIYGQDPDTGVEPLTTDHTLIQSNSSNSILPGGQLRNVINTFMSWQNSGGDVTIHPTKSGQG